MTQMLAQREHDYFAETVICANCYIVAKNKRVEPSRLGAISLRLGAIRFRLGAISLQPDAIKFRFLASFFDEILKKRLLWE